jgi:hypothetical protein
MRTRNRSQLAVASLITGVVLVLAAAGAAIAASAPTAITGPVTSVGPTTATLTGTVNPNGQATTRYFEYGTSTSYGAKTSSVSAGSGTTNVEVSAAVTGLRAGTTYHYRLVATSGAGTSRGADGIFTTSSAPGAVTGTATDVTTTSATLNGTVDPNGRATTWYFQYGTSTSYGSKTPAKSAGSGTSSVNVSIAISGLKPGRVYHYRLVATSDAGTSRGADATFSTSGAPKAVTAPATAITPTSATLNGTVNPNGRATTWYFEYGTSTAYGSKTPSKSAGSGTTDRTVTATISNLSPSTTYHFRLVATNDAGTSRGADASFATSGVTIAASTTQLVYGHAVILSGTVSTKQSGETVIVLAEKFGAASFTSIATVVTGAGGMWSYATRPTIRTSYEASWQSAPSSAVTVGVRPLVTFRVLKGARFSTRVIAARSFAGRLVKLDRRSSFGQWVTVKRVRLNRHSTAVFRATLPHGVSKLRVSMSVNQAGPGYLAGISRTIVYHRR